MLTLALDTSTPLASVALGEGGDLLAESLLPVRATHSETVLPEIERLLGACERSPASLGRIVVGSGPGSFTGVRIAASLAKGLCFATGAPLLAFSSLAAIAATAGAEGETVALLDARRGQVYAASYARHAAGLVELLAPSALTLDALLAARPPAADRCYAGVVPASLRRRIEDAGARLLPPHLGVPRAGSLLWLAARQPDAGRVDDSASWEPGYVRASSAERERRA